MNINIMAPLYAYSSLFTISGSDNSNINRQTDRNKLCHTDKRKTSYITVYKIPKTCKIKIEKQVSWVIHLLTSSVVSCNSVHEHGGPCLRQVILAAAMFEISCEKPTDKQTYKKTNTKTPLNTAWLTRTDTCDHSSVTSSISVDMKTRAFAINFTSKCLTGDFPLRPLRIWAMLAKESTRLPGDTPSIWRYSAPCLFYLLPGRNLRWPRRMLTPVSMPMGQTDRRTRPTQ